LSVDAARVTGAESRADSGVRWTQIDGVNVAWSDQPGPLRASLIFRIGTADESLSVNGITHLVEHLALFPLGQQPHYQNGAVRTSLTSFDTAGDPAEVSTFLAGVCASLGALPADRLAMERRVVETEASRRPGGTFTSALGWRYGPNGPGLWSAEEFALQTVDAPALQAWADQVFTCDNAVLVLSGPPPASLRLPLRSRGRLTVPPLVDMLPTTPAWFEHSWPDVGMLTVLPRSSAAVAYTYALQRDLVENLRIRLGMAYSPTVDYEPYDANTALVFARADAHRDHLEQVAQVVAGTVTALAERGPSAHHMQEYRDTAVKQYSLPGAALSAALYEATDLLLSGTYTPIGEIRARLEAMTDADVAEAARAARDGLLYALPQGVTLPVDRAVRAPQYSIEPPVTGHRLQPLGATVTGPPELVASTEGLTLDQGEGRRSTVRFASCRVNLAWPDGRRVIVSPEGISLTIEPTLWQSGKDIVELIDRSTAHVRVTRPAREDGTIPKPPAPTAPSPTPPSSPPSHRGRITEPATTTGPAASEHRPAAAFAYDSSGRPLNQFGTAIDVPYEPLWPDTTPTPRRSFAWRTRRPAPATRAAVIALVVGALATLAGGQGLRTTTTTGLPAGQARDGTAGATYDAATLDSLFHTALLLGMVAVTLGVLTLVGVRAAGALLLLAFTIYAGSNVYSLVTLGTNYFQHSSVLLLGLSVGGFLSMTNKESLSWIRRG
jgi:hypothetical protein